MKFTKNYEIEKVIFLDFYVVILNIGKWTIKPKLCLLTTEKKSRTKYTLYVWTKKKY